MPGNILIVDPILTNRIVLKVKLAAACYQVGQAQSGAEGLDAARRLLPDLILCSGALPDMDIIAFAEALRTDKRTADIPLVIESIACDAETRLAALAAGTDDILLKPYEDSLLLARLRSLLRVRETADELNLREGASRAIGLAEPLKPYSAPGRVAIVAASAGSAERWRERLAPHFSANCRAVPLREAIRRLEGEKPPDAVALILDPAMAEAGLQLVADLRAKRETRDTGIVVLIESGTEPRIAAEALDRGAGDVILETVAPREVALRLNRQIGRKQTLERLRADMRKGLRAALTDPLTGLFNRRYAMPRLAAIADAAARARRDFAVMIIDVDHFKLINDRFGHPAGDAVLTRLAEVLQEATGEDDLLARIGGEEFMIAMPNAGRRAAQMAARRICETIRETAFHIPGRARAVRITASIGVALGSEVAPAPERGTSWQLPHEAVLERADKALYGAKTHGRNQVTFFAERPAA